MQINGLVSLWYQFLTERYLRADFNGKHLPSAIIFRILHCNIDWTVYKEYSFTQCKSRWSRLTIGNCATDMSSVNSCTYRSVWPRKSKLKKKLKYIIELFYLFYFIDYQTLDASWCIVDTIYYVELYQFQCAVPYFEKTVYLVLTIFDFYFTINSVFVFHLPWKHMYKYGCFSTSFVVQVTNFGSFMGLSMQRYNNSNYYRFWVIYRKRLNKKR